jgi:hypothetical protein
MTCTEEGKVMLDEVIVPPPPPPFVGVVSPPPPPQALREVSIAATPITTRTLDSMRDIDFMETLLGRANEEQPQVFGQARARIEAV